MPAHTAGAAGRAGPNAGYGALRTRPPAPPSQPRGETAFKNVVRIVVAFISKDLQN